MKERQVSRGKKTLFISWSGAQAKALALGLKDLVFDHIPGLQVFLSPEIPAGRQYYPEILTALSQSSWGLVVLTSHSADAPWVNFEAGHLVGRLGEIKILKFDSEIPEGHPLSNHQITSVLETLPNAQTRVHFEAIEGIAMKIAGEIGDQNRDHLRNIQVVIRAQEPKFTDLYERSMPAWSTNVRERIRTSSKKTFYATEASGLPHIKGNPCLQEIACKAVEDLAKTMKGLDKSHSEERPEIIFQRLQYPKILIHLQEKEGLACQVQAVAIVDEVEEFWSGNLGDRIAERSNRKSQRIFVFKDPEVLKKHWTAVTTHASLYTVRVLGYEKFARITKPNNVDFSILSSQSSSGKVLARYGRAKWSIEFSSSDEEIQKYTVLFDKLVEHACRVDPVDAFQGAESGQEQLKNCTRRIFPNSGKGTYFQMSEEIPAQEYDMYEEDHPFFQEMMGQMLDDFNLRRGKVPEARVLELGAGTGHFTKRIAQELGKDMEGVAVEYDPDCFDILKQKFFGHGQFKTELADSIAYDPVGKFDFIFSSFAEHHIEPKQKKSYLDNVRNNLKPGGWFIVGDEFLRPHDRENDTEHFSALEAYHGFIIDLAEKRRKFGVKRLEQRALECGKKRKVDFKMSLTDYERHLLASGLVLVERNLITLKEEEERIGGIYVLLIQSK